MIDRTREYPSLPYQQCVNPLLRFIDKIWVKIKGRRFIGPRNIGKGVHDCALTSLYWAAPSLSESVIREAFLFCADEWPYAGVTNKEFQIALKFLNLKTRYCSDTETLETLLEKEPVRCVALLPYHYIAIVDGKIVGKDTRLIQHDNAIVYCHWIFH